MAAAGVVCAVTASALAAITLYTGNGPWNTSIDTSSSEQGEPDRSNGRHPEFTGPDRIELTIIWGELNSRLGRDVLEDGTVTGEEMTRIERAYNDCLSVYGLQSRRFTGPSGGEGESIVRVHGSLDDDEQPHVIDQCRTDTDYGTLSRFYYDDHGVARGLGQVDGR